MDRRKTRDRKADVIQNQHEEMDLGNEEDRSHTQSQRQLQRSLEASKQMLYGTYGNVISILEEFEKREMNNLGQRQQMPKSNIPIPPQDHKGFEDIEGIVNTQLLLFETQTKACPPEVLVDLKGNLKELTIRWAGVRTEMGVTDLQKTDHYISKLYEILAKGSTKHNTPSTDNVTEDVMREGFQAIVKGTHDKEMLDAEFKTDPNKKACAPDMRCSEMIEKGAERIALASGNKELGPSLQKDIEMIHRQGPNDLK